MGIETAGARPISCQRCGSVLVTSRVAIGLIVEAKSRKAVAQKTCYCGQSHTLTNAPKTGHIVARSVLV